MKHVLIYGDSNTYGFSPVRSDARLPEEQRWVNLLQRELGGEYAIIPEGLNGRTTAFDWPEAWQEPGVDKNGLATLPTCLRAHPYANAVIFMLGTNDCSFPFGLSAEDIAGGLERLLELTREALPGARLGIIAPAPILPDTEGTLFADQVDRSSSEKSRALAPLYRALAERFDALFLDAAGCEVHTVDCEHLTPAGHRELARRAAATLRGL